MLAFFLSSVGHHHDAFYYSNAGDMILDDEYHDMNNALAMESYLQGDYLPHSSSVDDFLIKFKDHEDALASSPYSMEIHNNHISGMKEMKEGEEISNNSIPLVIDDSSNNYLDMVVDHHLPNSFEG